MLIHFTSVWWKKEMKQNRLFHLFQLLFYLLAVNRPYSKRHFYRFFFFARSERWGSLLVALVVYLFISICHALTAMQGNWIICPFSMRYDAMRRLLLFVWSWKYFYIGLATSVHQLRPKKTFHVRLLVYIYQTIYFFIIVIAKTINKNRRKQQRREKKKSFLFIFAFLFGSSAPKVAIWIHFFVFMWAACHRYTALSLICMPPPIIYLGYSFQTILLHTFLSSIVLDERRTRPTEPMNHVTIFVSFFISFRFSLHCFRRKMCSLTHDHINI